MYKNAPKINVKLCQNPTPQDFQISGQQILITLTIKEFRTRESCITQLLPAALAQVRTASEAPERHCPPQHHKNSRSPDRDNTYTHTITHQNSN